MEGKNTVFFEYDGRGHGCPKWARGTIDVDASPRLAFRAAYRYARLTTSEEDFVRAGRLQGGLEELAARNADFAAGACHRPVYSTRAELVSPEILRAIRIGRSVLRTEARIRDAWRSGVDLTREPGRAAARSIWRRSVADARELGSMKRAGRGDICPPYAFDFKGAP